MERVLRINQFKGISKKENFESCIRLVATIITEKVDPEFCHLNKFRKRSKYLLGDKQMKRYQNVLQKIYDFCLELRSEFRNPIDRVIEDYLRSVYERYAYYNSIPFTNQLGPSGRNEEGFLVWIDKWEKYYEESYWIDRIPNQSLSKSLAKKHMSGFLPFELKREFCDPSIVEV